MDFFFFHNPSHWIQVIQPNETRGGGWLRPEQQYGVDLEFYSMINKNNLQAIYYFF